MSIENTQFHTMVHNKPPNLTPCLEDIWDLKVSYKENDISSNDFLRRVLNILQHDVPYKVISTNCRSFITGYFKFQFCTSKFIRNKDLWKMSSINMGYTHSSLMHDVWLYFSEKNDNEIPRIITFDFSKIYKYHTDDDLNKILGGWVRTITHAKLCSIRKKVLNEYKRLLKHTWDLDMTLETSENVNIFQRSEFEGEFTPDLLCIEINKNNQFDSRVSNNIDLDRIVKQVDEKYLKCISPLIKELGKKNRAILYYYYCFTPDDGSKMTDQKISDLMTEKGYSNVSTRETINIRRNAVEEKLRDALLNCS